MLWFGRAGKREEMSVEEGLGVVVRVCGWWGADGESYGGGGKGADEGEGAWCDVALRRR